jgi:hypothetical protein
MKEIKVKPVKVSEIKDKKILREAVEQIHREPTQEDIVHTKELEAFAKRMLGQ